MANKAGPRPEDRAKAHRNARFTFAARRIRQIVDGAPQLTDEQLEQLALILHGAKQAS